jgi:hypothetical protein
MINMNVSKEIMRKTLRSVSVSVEDDKIIARGEFGANTFIIIPLEIKQIVVSNWKRGEPINDAEAENRRLWWEVKYFWQSMEGKSFKELESVINSKGGKPETEDARSIRIIGNL